MEEKPLRFLIITMSTTALVATALTGCGESWSGRPGAVGVPGMETADISKDTAAEFWADKPSLQLKEEILCESGQESTVEESQTVLPPEETPGNIIPTESIVEESQAVPPSEETPGNIIPTESVVEESQAVSPSEETPGNIIPTESIVEESQAVPPSEENPGNITLPETAVRENSYEDSRYELLDEEGVQAYLKSLGMEDVSPVCFYSPEGAPKLELYYDRETGQGCGLEYEETEDGTCLQGFEISGYGRHSYYWNFHNPYSTQIAYGEAWRIDRIPVFLSKRAGKLEETYTYDSENRLSAYHLRGCVKTEEGESGPEELFTASFFYRENGTLQEKEYQFNKEVFGGESVDWNPHYVYDELERLLYVEYGRRGAFDTCYLIYEGDSMIPTAYLRPYRHASILDRVVEQDYHNRVDVPRDGVDAFLSQVGLSRQDKYYEYQWHNESSDAIVWSYSDEALTLYFDPERELGCGYVDYPGKSLVDMSGFMFRGCMEIDCREYDPYGVFASYEGDSMEEIYLGNLPPEKLQDAFRHESLYVCEYDGGILMRVWMYGTGSDTERFFIYDGDSDMPAYCLNLVYGVTHGATLFKFVY